MNKECLYRIYNFHNELELINLWHENVWYIISHGMNTKFMNIERIQVTQAPDVKKYILLL